MTPDDPHKPGGPPEPTDPGTAVDRRVTYPPKIWDRETEVVSSAGRGAGEQAAPPLAPGGSPVGFPGGSPVGSDDGDYDPRLTERRAREILGKRFAAAGVALQPDYPFRQDDLLVTLDGYDPARRIGYAFVSHADADVVTDFDEATGEAFRQLAAAGRAHVLVVHDSDVPTTDALERLIDAFFHYLPR